MCRKVRLEPGMQALYSPSLYIQLCPEAWIEKLQQRLLWPVRCALIMHLVVNGEDLLSKEKQSQLTNYCN